MFEGLIGERKREEKRQVLSAAAVNVNLLVVPALCLGSQKKTGVDCLIDKSNKPHEWKSYSRDGQESVGAGKREKRRIEGQERCSEV